MLMEIVVRIFKMLVKAKMIIIIVNYKKIGIY